MANGANDRVYIVKTGLGTGGASVAYSYFVTHSDDTPVLPYPQGDGEVPCMFADTADTVDTAIEDAISNALTQQTLGTDVLDFIHLT